MAYANGDNLLVVRGNLGDSEIWSNTWAFSADAGDPQYAAVVTAFHDFYDELATGGAPIFGSEWNCVSASRIDKFNNTSEDPSWATITGTNANFMLPYECAIRVSINDGVGGNGGPFLAGLTVESVTASGLLKTAYQTVIHDALVTLNTDLDAVGCDLALHLPKSSGMLPVHIAKVGQVFDVIRRRRNNLLEAYSAVTFS